jgi:hypothetical protein
VYLVVVVNKTANQTYYHQTRELSFELPTEWQPTGDVTHEFEWRVVVASIGASSTPVPSAYTTEKRTFTWKGR